MADQTDACHAGPSTVVTDESLIGAGDPLTALFLSLPFVFHVSSTSILNGEYSLVDGVFPTHTISSQSGPLTWVNVARFER